MSSYYKNNSLIKIINYKQEDEKEQKKIPVYISSPPPIITQENPNYLKNVMYSINPISSSLSYNLDNNEDYLLPPKSNELINKKTLILDLDETLVHSSFTPFQKNDIILDVDFEGIINKIYVLVRPYAEEFLKNVSQLFEIVIFTASISKYASPLLDILDKGKNIKFRLYREHCTYFNGIFIKNLKRLNRNLKDIIIVDNSPFAYAFDPENGLPIKSWYDDPDDIELKKIEPLIIFLSKVKDVRKYIDKFVDDNEILFNKAISIINCEKKKLEDLKEEEGNNNTNNSDIDDKKTYLNKKKIKLKEYKINLINNNNYNFNLFSFNNFVEIKNLNTNNNNSSSKSLFSKLCKYNNNKQIENNNEINAFEKYKCETTKEFGHKGNKSQTKTQRANIGILLRKNSSKKKNIFLISQKVNTPTYNPKLINNNNNPNNLIPIVLPLSYKNAIEQKKENANNINNKNNIIALSAIKNNSIENRKKQKFTNLFEQFKKKEKEKKNEIKYNNEKIKITFSIANNYPKLLPINTNQIKIKDYQTISNSYSIKDVLKFNYMNTKSNNNNINKNIVSKTPNRHLLNIIGKDNYSNHNQKKGKKNTLQYLLKKIHLSKNEKHNYISHSPNSHIIKNNKNNKLNEN